MTAPLSAAAKAAFRRRTGGLASAWRVVRLDGDDYRFTQHDQVLDSRTLRGYSPKPGLVTFTNRRQAGLRDATTELAGLVDDGNSFPAGITSDDLEAGRLWGGFCWQSTLAWPFPWHTVGFNIWQIQDVEWEGHEWRLRLAGWTSLTKEKIGDIISRDCQNTLGLNAPPRSFCRANIQVAPFKVTSSTVTASITPSRVEFTCDGFDQTEHVNNYFDRGFVSIKSGSNVNQEELIELSSVGGGPNEFSLRLSRPMLFALEVGDTLDVFTGCDKTPTTCDQKFDQLQTSFRGFPDMGGMDELLISPSAT